MGEFCGSRSLRIELTAQPVVILFVAGHRTPRVSPGPSAASAVPPTGYGNRQRTTSVAVVSGGWSKNAVSA